MRTLAENLQILVANKKALKAVLEDKGKAPTDTMSDYPALIEELDNEEQVSYVLQNAEGTDQKYAQLASEDPISLTATENDIRVNTSAITEKGYTEGAKDIPKYYAIQGMQVVLGDTDIKLIEKNHNIYDYTKFQATLAIFNNSLSDSVQVDKVTVDDSLYKANTTTKLSDLSVDYENEAVNFGITNGDTTAVMRYFIMREEV